jgi:hypothetical protein
MSTTTVSPLRQRMVEDMSTPRSGLSRKRLSALTRS